MSDSAVSDRAMGKAQDVLESVFGYKQFRHSQADIIASMLQGEDVLALMPTGGGKSLCYQIPALLRSGVAVVVSPLIALMQDQVNALHQLGIRAACLNSSIEAAARQQIVNALRDGELDLLYVAPERLLTPHMLELLDQVEIALFAIDEAHCVSQWGHDFRREYQQLAVLHERFPNVPRIALTATADARTRSEIISQLGLESAQVFVNSFDRPNIRYGIVDARNAREEMWRFIQREHPGQAGIVYCLSRKKVESTAQWLQDKGAVALPYHAGLPDSTRHEHQERFLREDGVIMVATIAFGMGIDKPDVRFVAHLNLPRSLESYYQETGRAGRDGLAASAWMSYGLQDVITLRQMMQDSEAAEEYKRVSQHKLESMLGFCELTTCRRIALLSYFGEERHEPCGNCDNCLAPPETREITVEAQKAISCAYRTGQRFGVSYLIDVLRGKEDQRIKQNGHDRISTFGIGTDTELTQWRRIFRQLIAEGFLQMDAEGYGTLRLSEKCRVLLKGEQSLFARLDRQPPSKRDPSERGQRKSGVRSYEQPIFEKLKEKRLEIARERSVPPYVIFHDSTLIEMLRSQPQSLEELALVSGVGEKKLESYGQTFLDVLLANPFPGLFDPRLTDTVNESLALLEQGCEAAEIAEKRELSADTVYNHLSQAIELGLLDSAQACHLSANEVAEISTALEAAGCCDSGKLKPAFEALEGRFDYGILRCVQAEFCV
ncbi:MAG: DNA helicase RecQ [Thiotrichales bacterium]